MSNNSKIVAIWLICLLTLGFMLVAGVTAPINDMKGTSFFRFIGRFHVLILHFPIVLLLLAPALELLARKDKWQVLLPLLPWFWFAAAISAVLTAILGLTLAASEGYSPELVSEHRFQGVALAIFTSLAAAIRFSINYKPSQWLQHIFTCLASGLVVLTFFAAHAGGNLVRGESYLLAHAPKFIQAITGYEDPASSVNWNGDDHPEFTETVQPYFARYCYDCHGSDMQKGNMRIDVMNPDMVGGDDAPKWHEVLNELNGGAMPPEDKTQPTAEERQAMVAWLTKQLNLAAESKKDDVNPILRRLTTQQYSNTLKDLLGLDLKFDDNLPSDGKSPMGFTNSASILQTSPLHLDNYKSIARSALDKALSIGEKPKTKHIRVTLGESINPQGKGSFVHEGFQNRAVKPYHFLVEFLNENGEVVEDSSAENTLVSLGQRGSSPERYRIAPDGMLLNAALPHVEMPPKSWQGPSPHLALQLKNDLPRAGYFEFRVNASKGYFIEKRRELFLRAPRTPLAIALEEDEIKTKNRAITLSADDAVSIKGMLKKDGALIPENPTSTDHHVHFDINFAKEGVYQIDIVYPTPEMDAVVGFYASLGGELTLEPRNNQIRKAKVNQELTASNIGSAYLDAGKRQLVLGGRFFIGVERVVVTPLTPEDLDKNMRSNLGLNPVPKNKSLVERTPAIRSYVGTRTDDGMDYAEIEVPQTVAAPLGEPQQYIFRGRLENFPIPAPETDRPDADSLAGIMMIGLWNDHLVKRSDDSGPPLLVKSLEFVGPYYNEWPSRSHKNIFFDSENIDNEERYTEEVLERFMSRAFRRAVGEQEVERYMDFWRNIRSEHEIYEASVKEVLVAVLSSPLFLFMPVEDPTSSETESSRHALASRLSYFLWNSPPDKSLMTSLSDKNSNLRRETKKMIEDERFWRFIKPFADQWLRLDRHNSSLIDPEKYPDYTRFVKRDMLQETYHFLHYVFSQDLPITNLIESDFAMLNQNLAEFYGIENVHGQHFRRVALSSSLNRGGLLSHGAFLSGHSDGIDGHPIKRAVWIMEKILGDEPPPAPPNVPELDPETPGFDKLTLKEQLEMHRDKDACQSCHKKIDPYGIVFENFNASGRWQDMAKGRPVDASSILPDGTSVTGVSGLKDYIINVRKDDFTRSVIKHLYAYALGRDIHFSDDTEIENILSHVRENNYRAQSVIEAIVTSNGFLNMRERNDEQILAAK